MTQGRTLRIGIDGRYVQDHFPGIGRYTYHLVDGLARLQTSETIVLFHNPRLRNTRYDLNRLASYSNIQLLSTNLGTVSFAEQLGWWGLARSSRIDLLFSPYYIKPYFLPCPSVVAVHDAVSKRYPQYMPSLTARVAFDVTTRLALATSRAVVTLSEASRDDLRRYFGVSGDKITVTHLAAGESFQPAPDESRNAIRAKYSLPDQFVLYVGINKPHKNLATLIDAWGMLKTQTPSIASEVKLVIAGREDHRYPELRRRVAKLGLVDDVRFLGDIPESDLPVLYSCATAFAFPSLYEGFGLPVLEAMACGVPVVCSNTSSLPEVAGDAAIMVDPLAVDRWSDALARVVKDGRLREEMADKSLERARQFSWPATADKTLSVMRTAAR